MRDNWGRAVCLSLKFNLKLLRYLGTQSSVLIPGASFTLFQVWFQNKRSKERRMKQLTSMGRAPFFGGSRKMRGFPMNLSPGSLDEPPPGFPYFTTADGKYEFGYGGPAGFHHEFFPSHHGHGPPGQPLSFNPQGQLKIFKFLLKLIYKIVFIYSFV